MTRAGHVEEAQVGCVWVCKYGGIDMRDSCADNRNVLTLCAQGSKVIRLKHLWNIKKHKWMDRPICKKLCTIKLQICNAVMRVK